MTETLAAITDTRTNVEVHVSDINESGVYLTAKTFEGDTLEGSMTFDELISHPEWRVCNTVYPVGVEIPDVAFSQPHPRKMIDDLRAMRKELSDLRYEEGGCCDRERYEVLRAADGPIRELERRLSVQKMIVSVSMKAMFGVWFDDLRDAGL